MPPTALERRAHAKVNLALSVGPPAPPKGYHPIASWFACVDLFDTVRLERLPAGAASRHEIAWASDAPRPTPIDWPAEKDLGVRAHRLLEEHAGRPLPLAMSVRKRTPVGGGLGGGSSDAAAVLAGVNDLFGLGHSAAELATLSARLGSDVAFFLDAVEPPRPAIVTGFGDRIERVAPVSADLLLIFPPFGCPTADVYRAYDGAGPEPLRSDAVRTLAARAAQRGSIPAEALFNDLAEPACIVEGRLRRVLERVRSVRAVHAYVTGSGSTVFALAAEAVDLEEAARWLAALDPSLVVLRARLI